MHCDLAFDCWDAGVASRDDHIWRLEVYSHLYRPPRPSPLPLNCVSTTQQRIVPISCRCMWGEVQALCLVDMVLLRLHLPALLRLRLLACTCTRTHTGTHTRTRSHYDSSRESQRQADFFAVKRPKWMRINDVRRRFVMKTLRLASGSRRKPVPSHRINVDSLAEAAAENSFKLTRSRFFRFN